MNPSGDVAVQQANLILISTALMLLIIIPVIVLTIVFAWKYRQSNTEAAYEPDWDHSTKLELVIWGAPLLIIIVLGMITWTSTHLLDPYRPLSRIDANRPVAADVKPVEVQVVALDWKWLFIYPELGIASVNELVTPVDVPVTFKITASTVMNSFYIPAMAGQIYAMPSMETTLHAVINKPGDFEGFSANYSGAGFSHMRFAYRGVSNDEFNDWVNNAKASTATLDRAEYLKLEQPSEREPKRLYSKVPSDLFHAIVNRCVDANNVCMDKLMAMDEQRIRTAGEKLGFKAAQSVPSQALCTADTADALNKTSLSMKNDYARAN